MTKKTSAPRHCKMCNFGKEPLPMLGEVWDFDTKMFWVHIGGGAFHGKFRSREAATKYYNENWAKHKPTLNYANNWLAKFRDNFNTIYNQPRCTGDSFTCNVDECEQCSIRDCPYGEPLHYHHDGCPACIEAEELSGLSEG